MNAVHFFSKEEKAQIKAAVKEAETNTSGEIRVHVDNHCREDVMDRAAWWFGRLEMHKTEKRNGVLFYLAVKDRKFAILGDAGINAVTPEDFWENIKAKMVEHFSEGSFALTGKFTSEIVLLFGGPSWIWRNSTGRFADGRLYTVTGYYFGTMIGVRECYKPVSNIFI